MTTQENQIISSYPIVMKDIRLKADNTLNKYVLPNGIYQPQGNYKELKNIEKYEFNKLSVGCIFTLLLINTNSLYYINYKCVFLDTSDIIAVVELTSSVGRLIGCDDVHYEELLSRAINRHRIDIIDDMLKLVNK